MFSLVSGDVATRRALDQRAHVNLMDIGPPDLDPTHVTNARLSVSLVKSDGCDFIL